MSIGLWILILTTGTRVLIWEVKVEPGQTYFAEEYGDLGKSTQTHLVGKYFNGRGIVHRVYYYSPNNFMGRDSCPFLVRD